MEIVFDIARYLDERLRSSGVAKGIVGEDFASEVRPAEARFGEFQANGVLGYTKRLGGVKPRELAEKLAAAMELDERYIKTEVMGPGFINFRLTPRYFAEWLQIYGSEEAFRGAAKEVLAGKMVVIDYSCPNTAKQMHVGHLRSMIIGDSLQRILRFFGANVVRDNHIGDWGTQFGILIAMIKRKGFDLDTPNENILDDLENLYREGNVWANGSDEAMAEAHRELVKLQNGDAENGRIWETINTLSYASFDEIYQQMGVTFDVVHGESFYRDKVDRVYRELKETEIAQESEGALVVFFRDSEKFKEQPLIVRKSDGASNYASTDLATVLYRIEKWNADTMVYVTDGRQRDHFQQIFLTVEKWLAEKGYRVPKMVHTWFGTVLGEDGKAIKTRSGGSIKLKDLMAEAVARALEIVKAKSAHLSEDEQKRIASVVGLGALKYADLSQNRTSDYIFAWDKLLSFDGNTAPYLLYAIARIHAIFRKVGIEAESIGANSRNPATGGSEKPCGLLETPAELTLARKLVFFPHTLKAALEDFRPHLIATYLFELASDFSTFYNADKVLIDEPAIRTRRLLLCNRTLVVLETGLHLLGIETLTAM